MSEAGFSNAPNLVNEENAHSSEPCFLTPCDNGYVVRSPG